MRDPSEDLTQRNPSVMTVFPAGRRVSAWALILGRGPRFARDAFGPVLAFYIGWKLFGLKVGIAAASLLAVVAYAWERRHARSGLTASIGLGIALVQAVSGIVVGSAAGYLAPPVIINAIYGLVFFVSVAVGRPLAAVFASEIYPFAPEVKSSATYRRVFSRISFVWGAYLLLQSVARLLTLSGESVELYLLVNLVSGIPCTAALMSWSIWYSVRSFGRSAGPDAARSWRTELPQPRVADGEDSTGGEREHSGDRQAAVPKRKGVILMPTVRETFEYMPRSFKPEQAEGMNATIQYEVSGENGGTWHAVIKDGTCTMSEGQAANPSVTLKVSASDWLDMVAKKQSGPTLFMAGKLKITGDMGLAMKLGALFQRAAAE